MNNGYPETTCWMKLYGYLHGVGTGVVEHYEQQYKESHSKECDVCYKKVDGIWKDNF